MFPGFLVSTVAFATILSRAATEEVSLTRIEDSVQRVTLEQALRMFEKNNLSLRVVAAERDEALGLARQSKLYPNPAAAVSHEGLSEQGSDYSESYFTVSQRLEWPGRRQARATVSEEEAEALDARFSSERLRLAFEVKRAFIEAATAEERAAVIREVLAVFRLAEASGQERLRKGDVSGYDARRLRIERARYESLGVNAALDLRRARLELASLILPGAAGEELPEIAPARAPEGAPPGLTPLLDEEAAVALALERRSEMRRAAAQRAAAEASIRYLSTFTKPDVTLTGGYKRQSDGFQGYFLSVNVPIPALDRRRGDIEAAEARLRAADARAELTRRRIENDVRSTLAAYRFISERIELIHGRLLGEVGDVLQIARLSYGEGEMTLLELLDAAEAFRESQVMVSELQAEYWIRFYDVERAMAGPPIDAAGEGSAR